MARHLLFLHANNAARFQIDVPLPGMWRHKGPVVMYPLEVRMGAAQGRSTKLRFTASVCLIWFWFFHATLNQSKGLVCCLKDSVLFMYCSDHSAAYIQMGQGTTQARGYRHLAYFSLLPNFFNRMNSSCLQMV